MSQEEIDLEGEGAGEIHYVLEDPEEYGEVAAKLGDVICSDGSRAVLVNGQYYLTEDQTQTVLLQDDNSDFGQYYFDPSGGLVVDGDNILVNNLLEGQEVVQLVEEDATDGQNIIYYTNPGASDVPGDEFAAAVTQSTDDADPLENLQDEDGNIYQFKRIRLDGQTLDLEDFIRQPAAQSQQDNILVNYQQVELQDGVRFTLMGDNYQLCTLGNATDDDSNTEFAQVVEEPPDEPDLSGVDFSKITGRNLITGHTVTLHSYMDKLKKKMQTRTGGGGGSRHKKQSVTGQQQGSKKPPPQLDDLLDKKISIGTTRSGKKIVGKIIHVARKGEAGATGAALPQLRGNEDQPLVEAGPDEEDEELVPHLVEDEDSCVIDSDPKSDGVEQTMAITESGAPEERTKVLVKKCPMSKESFEQISKTLGGVMEMDSVCKKLENKNIVVKLVEKRYTGEGTDNYARNTSYSYGYMEKEIIQDLTGQTMDRWKFVPDQNIQDALINQHELIDDEGGEEGGEAPPKIPPKFPVTTNITILITYGKGNTKIIKVNLNPATGNLCTICALYFKSSQQLRQHMNTDHNADRSRCQCELCHQTFDNVEAFQEHRNVHVEEGRLFICPECSKCFTTQARLARHMTSHDVRLRPLECSVCEVRCSTEWALQKHLLTHTGIQTYKCDICDKEFLTVLDLNFHKKGHFPEKNYACSVCSRTFSRHSNLLRHAEIHRGNGALYKCSICYCSYNYISSLTRHMVDNHMQKEVVMKHEQEEN